jgi:hypothetical protein
MDILHVDYNLIKERLRLLQPKNRMSVRDAHLQALRDELLSARNRGVSLNALSAELKSSGIRVSNLTLGRFLRRRKAKARTQRQVKIATSEPA